MKKKYGLAFLLLYTFGSNAQNVGIGTTNPSEKLHVSGNINVTGTIKANGVDGTANQVLMKNNAGVMEWGDVTAFKDFLSYYSNGSFTVPAGTTKIMVELWGGGGGGNFYCGGGGGGYIKATFAVIPGDICTIIIGNGGAGANNATATDGGNTSATVGSVQFTATGGKGAVYVASSRYNPGVGGAAVYSATPRSYIVVPGGMGGVQNKQWGQNTPTRFYEVTIGGNGGGTYKYPDAGGSGAQNLSNYETEATVVTHGAGADGKVPGGGGSGGLLSLGASVLSGAGARGMAVVYY